MLDQAISVILAGGAGTRLQPLTNDRAKPAVPFGGKYRIIDFTLTNCLHSGLRRILVLTQYKSHSLQKHIRDGWSIFNPELGEYITTVPPQLRVGEHFYAGTADAIYQNLYLLERSGAKWVLISPGDHIYRMDYAPMLVYHVEKQAELTIACMRVPLQEATQFGVMSVDKDHCVTAFDEKPRHPEPLPDEPDKALASMGIYIFSMEVLLEALRRDHEDMESTHDFGVDIIPQMIDGNHVYAYRFGEPLGRVSQDNYWRDVGTVDSYYQAHMDLLMHNPPIDLYQNEWSIRSYAGQYPPARTAPGDSGSEGIFIDSIVASGTVISGGRVQGSVLFHNVYIDDDAGVQGSILFSGVHVGKNAQLRNCIVDKSVDIPANTRIGFDAQEDRERGLHISEQGIVVVPKGQRFS